MEDDANQLISMQPFDGSMNLTQTFFKYETHLDETLTPTRPLGNLERNGSGSRREWCGEG